MKNHLARKQLAAYSTIAAAFLAIPKSDAQVIYTDIDPNHISDLTGQAFQINYFLDLDNDGVNDMLFQNWYASSRSTYWGQVNMMGNVSNAINGGVANSYYHAQMALVLDSGEAITSADVWEAGGNMLLYYDHRWLNQHDKYIGVRFEKTDGTHYGWVRLTVNANGSKVFVKDYAYESQPDVAINAGQTLPAGDGFEPNNSFGAAKTIVDGLAYHPLISTAGDMDFFKYHITLPNIRITLTGLPTNYNINLYDAAHLLIAQSVKQGTHKDTIVMNNIGSGHYFIKVYGANGHFNAADSYTLKIEAASTPFKEEMQADAGADMEVLLYPNPAHDMLALKFSAEVQVNELLIYNGTGQIVKQLSSFENTRQINLDIADLPPGIYLADVKTENDLILKKFIKQ